jgi:hypothetical protein
VEKPPPQQPVLGPKTPIDVKTPMKDEPGKFKTVIRRAGGGTVRTAVPPGPDVPAITTQSYLSAEDALAEAKATIIAGGII